MVVFSSERQPTGKRLPPHNVLPLFHTQKKSKEAKLLICVILFSASDYSEQKKLGASSRDQGGGRLLKSTQPIAKPVLELN